VKFPLLPFVVIGLIVVLIIAGLVMYSLDEDGSEDENGIINYNGNGNGNDVDNDDPQPSANSILLDTTDGDQIFLEQYKGKVVILDMFATWCNPCKIQMPELQELQAEFLPSELVILSIDADLSESMSLIREFKEEEGADWTFATSNPEFNSKFPASSIPTIYVLDTNGNVANTFVGVTQSEELIDEVNSLI
jgi:thiol-disulfide isomerase/thioredoxin